MTLVLTDVSQGYGGTRVIESLSLSLGVGVFGLLGPNGAGKSTLLRTMATVTPPASGTVTIGGRLIAAESGARIAREGIGYLPQDFGCPPSTRLEDFVAHAAWMRGMPPGEWGEAVRTALVRVDLLEQRRSRMRTLSGGMRQRAGIAWATVGEPSLILLDEPTVGLDTRQRLQFRRIVSELRESVIVLSTHLIDDIAAVCDTVIVLQAGSLRFFGPTVELASLARDDLPGHSALERAYMHLMPEQEQRL
jgi:ABC-2 type transport system ATP-binding protein